MENNIEKRSLLESQEEIPDKFDCNKLDETNGAQNIREHLVELEKTTISYISLFGYSSTREKCLVLVGLLFATLTGILPAWSNYTFGMVTKAMVDYASNISRQCPPSTVGQAESSLFMKEVEKFVIYQCLIGAFNIIAGYLFVMVLNNLAEKQVYKIRKEYFRKLLEQDMSWFDKNSKRDFSSRMVDDMLKLQKAMSEKLGMLVSAIINCIFLLALSFACGWKLTLALAAFIPVLAMITGFDANVQSTMASKEQRAYAEAGAVVEEVLSNIRTVQAFNGQSREMERYNLKILHAKAVAYKRHVLSGLGDGLIWMIFFLMFAFAFWYGSVLVVDSRERGDGLYGPDSIFVILFSVTLAGSYFGAASDYIEAVFGGVGAAEGIFPVLNRTSEINGLSEQGFMSTERPVGDIEFKNVSFSYPSRSGVPILENVSFRVKPGQTVALVGASGCGKSTCVQLLQRFYDVSDGEISFDGVDIRHLNVKWLRSQLGVVGQEPVLFNMSIAENISFGLQYVSREEIEAAAKQAYAHNFIMQLPKDYDTIVGERGASLSGGQKQRIAIARALVRNPSALLLDEATSALDFQSESIVQAALERARHGRSTIIIAHRLSTIKAADMIYVVDKGVIVEQGTHTELMKLKGRYHQLVLSQEAVEIMRGDHCEEQIDGEELNKNLAEDCFEINSRTREINRTTCLLHQEGAADDGIKDVSASACFWRLWKTNLHEWPYILAVVLCSMLRGIQFPVYAYIFGEFVQTFIIKDDVEVISRGRYYCFAYIGIAVIVGFCGFLQKMLIGFSGECLTYRIRQKLFSCLLNQDISFFDEPQNTVGKLTARLSTDASSIRGATGSRFAGVLQAFTIVIGAAIMSFYYIPKLAAVTIIFVPVVMYTSFLEGKVMNSDNVIERDSIEASCSLAVEALNNIRTVASLCAEKQCMRLYENALAESHRVNLKRSQIRGVVYGVVTGGPIFCYCLCVGYGGYLVEQSCVNIGDVFKVAEGLIVSAMFGAAAISYAPDYDKGKLAAKRIFELLDSTPIISGFSNQNQFTTFNTNESEAGESQVDFENVSFSYKNRPSVNVLKDLTMNVKSGESIAICGPSGSGKTTCAALIFRFYDPTTGRIKLAGTDLKHLNLDHLRKQIALVSQEPVLFDCSIKDNIAYGDNERSLEMNEIINLAIATNIHNFIMSLPAGYETRVGLLGSQLSGGQKQRIAIARAILRRPKLLVLDEATSALDSENEVAVQTALDSVKKATTTLTIAHRLSSIINSDKIFVMKGGSIVECGTHAELIGRYGMYQSMWKAQSSLQTT